MAGKWHASKEPIWSPRRRRQGQDVKLRGLYRAPRTWESLTHQTEGQVVDPNDDERIQAQNVLNRAVEGGFFAEFVNEMNCDQTHEKLRLAAEDLLAEQYPDLAVKIKVYPESQYVDLVVERRRPRRQVPR